MSKTLFVFAISIFLMVCANLGYSAVPEGLILALPFDEGKGEEVKDASGKGFVGKGVNTKWADGKFGKALEFNGKDAHAEVPGGIIADLPKNQISFGAWFFLTGHDGWDGIVSMTGVLAPIGGQCCQYRIMVSPEMKPFYDMGEHNDVTVPNPTFEVKKWYHYVATYDSKDVKIYVDGKVIHTEGKAIKLPTFKTPLLVGTGEAPGVHPTQGIIDEVFVYNRAIDEKEVNSMMKGFKDLLAVEPKGKLPVSWGKIKGKY